MPRRIFGPKRSKRKLKKKKNNEELHEFYPSLNMRG
jgi:hypothetical protein